MEAWGSQSRVACASVLQSINGLGAALYGVRGDTTEHSRLRSRFAEYNAQGAALREIHVYTRP